ncbi:hypothetical protein [Chitinophaga solisilvae]|uniref:hypothetical protein n=1 Tax=Chitinophaga solisilvae TaxID=1233460 RepID=UPI00136F3257|nr:hypothetical protein [Chitinophaga solisilvae]
MKRNLLLLSVLFSGMVACKKNDATVNPAPGGIPDDQPDTSGIRQAGVFVLYPIGTDIQKDSIWPDKKGHSIFIETLALPVVPINVDKVFPGAVLKGNSIESGNYVSLTGYTYKPQAVVMSTDINALPLTTDAPGPDVTKAYIKNVLKGNNSGSRVMLAGISGAEKFSKILVSLNGKPDHTQIETFDISGGVCFNYDIELFSLTIDIPRDGEFFTTPLSETSKKENPVYVASVTYGRRAALLVTSRSKNPEDLVRLRTAAVKVSRKEDISNNEADMLEKAFIRYYYKDETTGNDMAVREIKGLKELREIITGFQQLAVLSPDKPGTPITFRTRSLIDFSSYKMSYQLHLPL